jgi:hypothetical protein
MKIIQFFLLSLIVIASITAQNVSISPNGTNPHQSAGLDIDFPNKGLLIPRIELTATNSSMPITGTPAISLLIYNTANVNDVTPGYYYWNGTQWVSIGAANVNEIDPTWSGVANTTAMIGREGQTGIGITIPEQSAILDAHSTTKGFLPPRMTTNQRNNINNPADGLVIYNVTTECINYFASGFWLELCGSKEIDDEFNCSTDNVTFNYNGNFVTYGTVEGQNGTCWLDRNLGANQVCISSDDVNCLGDLFQWGRYSDGHQIRNPLSDYITVLSPTDNPGHNRYIRNGNYTKDWRETKNDNLWQGVTGVNNPCPTGWRIPTIQELDAERQSWTTNNAAGAFASVLKLSIGGRRVNNTWVDWTTTNGSYWSSTPDTTDPNETKSRALWIHNMAPSGNAGTISYDRQNAVSVRCIKN